MNRRESNIQTEPTRVSSRRGISRRTFIPLFVTASGIAVVAPGQTLNAFASHCEHPSQPISQIDPEDVNPCEDTYVAEGIFFRLYRSQETGKLINGVPDAQLKVEVLEKAGSSMKPILERRGLDRFYDAAIGRERAVVAVHYFTANGQTNGILTQDGTGADSLRLTEHALTDCDTQRGINLATMREDDNAVAWLVFSRMNENRTDVFRSKPDNKPESYLGKLYWFKVSNLRAGVPLQVAHLGSISDITDDRRKQLKIDYNSNVFIPREDQGTARVG